MLRRINTIDYIGLWEEIHNQDFNLVEFDQIKTDAHSDIAFEFASWLSPEFKLYLITEFERLKANEAYQEKIDWQANRILAKLNYVVHTDAVKAYIVPTLTEAQKKVVEGTTLNNDEGIIYTGYEGTKVINETDAGIIVYGEYGDYVEITIEPDEEFTYAYQDKEAVESTITSYEGENGTVTAPDKAVVNDEVTLVVTPQEGYQLASVTVKAIVNGEEVEIEVVDGKFLMPLGDVKIDATFVNAKNEEEYNNYVENAKEASLYDTGKTAKYGEQLLTLSTCEYSQEDGRFVVVARKKHLR